MTIIHISSSLGGGGAEQMVYQLTAQSKGQFRTIVFSISNENTLEYKFKDHDIEYHFLGITSFKNSSLRKGLRILDNKIKDCSDVVFHCHQFHGVLLGMLYKKLYKNVPIVFTLHSSTIEHFNRKLLLYLSKSLRKYDIVFSANASQWYLKNNAVIPNGIDFESLAMNDKRVFEASGVFSFLFLGRLSKEKNPLMMVEAAKHLIGKNIHNFVINVVGDGTMRNELIEEIKEHELTTYFNLFGFQKNIKEFLKNSNCLILPSLWEGMPVVIIESAAAHLPIIATPVGSIPDILNNSNARLSSLDDFPDAMLNTMQNYDRALEKSNILHNEMRSIFNIEHVYNLHQKLYESLIK